MRQAQQRHPSCNVVYGRVYMSLDSLRRQKDGERERKTPFSKRGNNFLPERRSLEKN